MQPSSSVPDAADRDDAARGRDEAADLRDDTSEVGDREAERRDRSGERRDVAADLRDRAAERLEAALRPSLTSEALRTLHQVRADSASDRRASAEDRRSHAADRAHHAEDRTRAEADRSDASTDRAGGVRDRSEARLDGLTGAYRRGEGRASLEREVARCERTGERVTVAFVDVDHLKSVNDTQGHAAGDALLVHVADALTTMLRPYDLVVRQGGDEFVCVMPGLGARAATARLATVDHELAGATVSVGVAQLREGETAADLLHRADTAMYAGRHRRRRQEDRRP
jgi:diguanylate cyclase (GGDEF)-like protein